MPKVTHPVPVLRFRSSSFHYTTPLRKAGLLSSGPTSVTTNLWDLRKVILDTSLSHKSTLSFLQVSSVWFPLVFLPPTQPHLLLLKPEVASYFFSLAPVPLPSLSSLESCQILCLQSLTRLSREVKAIFQGLTFEFPSYPV